MDSIYFGEEHELFRSTLRRFIDEEVIPFGDSWEEAGEVPRDVLCKMGALGFLGIRYPSRYGGAEMEDQLPVEHAGRYTQ